MSDFPRDRSVWTRRDALRGLAGAAAFGGLTGAAALGAVGWPRLAFAAGPAQGFDASERPLLVVVLLRGGLDGLTAVPAYGDPDYGTARGDLADPPPGEDDGPRRLDDLFALHRGMPNAHGFYERGELLVVHAAASPYRERSHFDAQNVLESGVAEPFARSDGWLNRALADVSQRRPLGAFDPGLAIGASLPLALRGAEPAGTWSPSELPAPSPAWVEQVAALYADDPPLSAALDNARRARAIAGDLERRAPRSFARRFSAQARAAGVFLRDPAGPSVAMLESGGWDTHAYQDLPFGAPHSNLAALDRGLAALSETLGPAWRRTVVVVVTEFGRTVAMNGSRGTDHGTAGVAFLAGGAVAGGRVIADWPGLAPAKLHEGRDLRPTTDLRSLWKGVLRDHLAVSTRHLEHEVFPDSGPARPLDGLVRSGSPAWRPRNRTSIA